MDTPRDPNHPDPVTPAEDSPEAEKANAVAKGWLGRNGRYLLLVAAFFMVIQFWFNPTPKGWLTGGLVALGLSVVIFVHELGHFMVAKWCDVHVQTFSIGFGPPLPGCCFVWGETMYKIALVPLGGYVKMVGEGPDEDDTDRDPRSFKNKPVWQRMAIISAGVTMNMILAFICFVFVFRVHGDEQLSNVIGLIDSGSPVWQSGARSGDVIYRIGDKGPQPAFEALQEEVMNSTRDQSLAFVFGPPNAKESELTHAAVTPRLEKGDLKPTIGLLPADQPRLFPEAARKGQLRPVRPDSAASQAEPPFQFDDTVLATTDPDHPDRLKELPPDPRDPKHLDYFEFQRRMDRLAGRPVAIQVGRKDKTTATIQVPPAYHYSLGLRMGMGKVTAVRAGSPAANAGVQPGDVIEQVEVRGDRLPTWGVLSVGFMTSPLGNDPLTAAAAVSAARTDRVRFSNLPSKAGDAWNLELDPARLPFDLAQLAGGRGAGRVKLSVVRENPPSNHTERQRLELTMPWDNSWSDNLEIPMNFRSPLSVRGLGLAYLIETTVDGVRPDSPAARQGLQKGDAIEAVYFYPADAPQEVEKKEWKALKADQWARFAYIVQTAEARRVALQVARTQPGSAERTKLEVDLTSEPDLTWPAADRGLDFLPDVRLKRADTWGEAFHMGWNKSTFFIKMLLGNLRGFVTGRLSPENLSGPIGIAKFAYLSASESIYKFLIFLGIIGVNLAVVNFLPIPVLDGGHMVLLAYERLRGKPAPERVQVAATLVGLTLILSLVVFSSYFDVKKFF